MALAVDIMHGHGHSNEMRAKLQPEKTKVRLHYPLILQQKVSNALYITKKTEHGPWCRYNAWA